MLETPGAVFRIRSLTRRLISGQALELHIETN